MSKKSFINLAIVSTTLLVFLGCSATTPKEETIVTNPNLTSIQTEGYHFYYPNYYQETSIPGYQEGFASTELNALGGSNNIGTTLVDNSGSGKTNQEGCQEVAQMISDTLKQAVDMIESSVVENAQARTNGDVQECYIKVKYQMSGFTMYNEQRQLWTSGKEDENIYGVSLTYSDSSPESEISDLQDALAGFQLL